MIGVGGGMGVVVLFRSCLISGRRFVRTYRAKQTSAFLFRNKRYAKQSAHG